MLPVGIGACLNGIFSIQVWYMCVYSVLLEQHYINYGQVNSAVSALKVLFDGS